MYLFKCRSESSVYLGNLPIDLLTKSFNAQVGFFSDGRSLYLLTSHSTLDTNQWFESGHLVGQAGTVGGLNHFCDILVGTGRLLGHAA